MEKIPIDIDLSNFYWIVGALIFMNLGTIVTVLASAGRAVWFISKMDSRVEKNTHDINAAHSRIRKLEVE